MIRDFFGHFKLIRCLFVCFVGYSVGLPFTIQRLCNFGLLFQESDLHWIFEPLLTPP